MSEFRDYKNPASPDVTTTKRASSGSGMMVPIIAVVLALIAIVAIYSMATGNNASPTAAPDIAPNAPIEAPAAGSDVIPNAPSTMAPAEPAPTTAPAPTIDNAPSTTPSTTPAPAPAQ